MSFFLGTENSTFHAQVCSDHPLFSCRNLPTLVQQAVLTVLV